MHQYITCAGSAENAYQVGEQGFPDSKLELMHEVYNQHEEQIEAKASEPLRKRILKDRGQYSVNNLTVMHMYRGWHQRMLFQ
jgi:hypothetical protein